LGAVKSGSIFEESVIEETRFLVLKRKVEVKSHKQLAVLFIACLLTGISSCKPQRAIDFKEAIVQKEQMASKMLVSQEGSEAKKLDLLIEKDFKGALAVIDQQEREFDTLITTIEALPVDGIKRGHELKMAAMEYYVALKALQLFDREQIKNREASQRTESDALRAVQDKDLELSLRKQELYKTVFEKDSVFYQAQKKFDEANGI